VRGYSVTQSTEKNYLLGVYITENQQTFPETPGDALASPVSVRQANPLQINPIYVRFFLVFLFCDTNLRTLQKTRRQYYCSGGSNLERTEAVTLSRGDPFTKSW